MNSPDSKSTKPHVETVFLLASGDIAAFTASGQQIPELQQKTAIDLFADRAITLGYSMDYVRIETQAPNGAGRACTLIPTTDGFHKRWD